MDLNDRQRRLLRTLVDAIDGDDYTQFMAVQTFGGWSISVLGFRPNLPQRELPQWTAEFEERDLKALRAAGYIELERKGSGRHGHYEGRVYGLDLASGKKVREYEAALPVTSSPAVALGQGRRRHGRRPGHLLRITPNANS
jgi:hypothetical protein